MQCPWWRLFGRPFPWSGAPVSGIPLVTHSLVEAQITGKTTFGFLWALSSSFRTSSQNPCIATTTAFTMNDITYASIPCFHSPARSNPNSNTSTLKLIALTLSRFDQLEFH